MHRWQDGLMGGSEQEKNWQGGAIECGPLALLLFVLPFLLLQACQLYNAHPTDKIMVQEFRDNQAGFSKLREMIAEEQRVTRVARDFIWIDGMRGVSEAERPNYLSDSRWGKYRALFDRVKLESGVMRYEDGSVGFIRSSSGIVTSGSSKEFIWSQKKIASLLESTDERSLEDGCVPKTGCSSIRQIATEWYISFESN